MNKHEEKEIGQRFLEVYKGILFNSQTFEKGQDIACSYDFNHTKFEELKSRYPIVQVAGKGGDFERSLRICKWLSINISHQGDFSLTSSIDFNSISLLDYAFVNSEHGINCVGKAKILLECCLALGIFARRIGLYPNSPYDIDNHIVVEVYDRKRKKWIMLDPTSGGYFFDGKNPLSCIEMRENFALNSGGSIVLPRQKKTSLEKLNEKNLSWNFYYAKNCYYINVESFSGFGKNDKPLVYLLPLGFDLNSNLKQNADFLLETAIKEGWSQTAIDSLKNRVQNSDEFIPLIGSKALWNAPKQQA